MLRHAAGMGKLYSSDYFSDKFCTICLVYILYCYPRSNIEEAEALRAGGVVKYVV